MVEAVVVSGFSVVVVTEFSLVEVTAGVVRMTSDSDGFVVWYDTASVCKGICVVMTGVIADDVDAGISSEDEAEVCAVVDCFTVVVITVEVDDNSDVVCPFDGEGVDKKNRLIKMAEEEFVKLTDCYAVNYSDKFIAQQSGVKNRAFTAAYETEFYVHCAKAVDSIVKGESRKKLYDNVDILSYIERAHRILKANPGISYDLQKQLFGDMTPLVKE